MKTIITMTIFVLTAMAAYGQNIYTKTLGSTSDKPIIFFVAAPVTTV